MDGIIAFTVPVVAMATPCIGVCVIDEDDTCTGCARTLDEIARWTAMTAAERDAVMAALPARRQSPLGINASSIARART